MAYQRLTSKGLEQWRVGRIIANGGRCALCSKPIKSPCADHDHATGIMRDAICRSCNSGLGQVERAVSRFGIPDIAAFLAGALRYMQKHSSPQTEYLHPSHKSEEEKRDARNKKARLRRAAAKEK